MKSRHWWWAALTAAQITSSGCGRSEHSHSAGGSAGLTGGAAAGLAGRAGDTSGGAVQASGGALAEGGAFGGGSGGVSNGGGGGVSAEGGESIGGAPAGGDAGGSEEHGETGSQGGTAGGSVTGGTAAGGASTGGVSSGPGGAISGGTSSGGTATGGSPPSLAGSAGSGGQSGAATCGNGMLDANELCDGSSLGKATCQTLNFDDGQLDCAVDCRSYDTSSCALKTQLSVGRGHACVRFQDGRIKCWGSNFLSGALGLGDKVDRGVEVGTMGDALPFVDVGAVAKRVYAGYSQTCALLIDDSLVCWGANYYGELGMGDTRYRGDDPGETGAALRAVDLGTGRHATQVTMGDSHVCAILDNQQLKCWGFNGYGTLGVGDRQNRGDDPNEMGDALPAIDLGTGRHAVTVRAGRTHTCAILDNYTIKCWGDNAFGELGLGDNTNRGWAPNQMGDELPSVDLGTSARPLALVVGGVFSCAVLEGSKMKCWGWNGSGQLGQGDTTPRGWQPNQMGSQLPYTDLGSGLSIAEISATGSERAHACALFTSGAVKCWGANTAGVLGLGDTADRGDSPNEMGDALPFLDLGPKKVVSIGTGIGHACALLDDETVRCWGNPNHGVLGLADGEYNSIGDQPGEMGINLRPVELL